MLDVKKILIIETAFIGDAVLSLALAEEIKRIRPDIDIYYLVSPNSAEIMSYSPSVKYAYNFDKRGADSDVRGVRRMANILNEEQFDAVFSLHESHRTAKLLSLIDARYKIGAVSAKALHPYLTHPCIIPSSGRRTTGITEFARFFKKEINNSTLPKLVFDNEVVPADVRGVDNVIVLAPGSAWSTKKWEMSRFIEVGRELAREGNTIIVIGGKEDTVVGSTIARGIGSRAINYAGAASIVTAGAIISRAKLVIGNDSAPIHIATACGVRTVEIMGPTVQSFGFVPPPELGIVVEQEGLWCRPCNSHGGEHCPIYTHECMNGISSQRVIIAAQQLLVNAAS